MIWTLEHGGLEGVGNQSITKAESCFSKNRVTVGQSESLCRMSMWPIAARTDCLIFARFKLRFNFHPNIEYSLRPEAKSGRRATESRSWRAFCSLRSMSRHVSRDADPDATFFGFRAEAADLPGGTVRNVLEHRGSGPSRSEPYGTVNGRRFRSTVTVG